MILRVPPAPPRRISIPLVTCPIDGCRWAAKHADATTPEEAFEAHASLLRHLWAHRCAQHPKEPCRG